MMKRDGHAAAVGMAVALVGAALIGKREAITHQSVDDLSGGEIAQPPPFDHTVTATSGSSETGPSAGTGLPSSTNSAAIISITSRICRSASSRV